MSDTPAQDDLLLVGTIVQPFGIKGLVKLHTVMSNPEQLGRIKTVFVGPKLTSYKITRAAPHKPGVLLLTLAGVDNRTAAENLQQSEVYIRASDAAPLAEEEYFLHDLPGMEVRTTDGTNLGTVKEVLETGANDVIVVKRVDEGEVLIPMIRAIVKDMDLATRVIIIEPMPGLLD